MSDLGDRLDQAVKKRNRLNQAMQRAKGRLDSAQENVSKIETEIRGRGIEPDQLGATIKALEGRLKAAVEELELRLREAETALTPYMGED